MTPIAITAQDIRRVEFRERLRGYHQGDVDEFLERVASAIETLEEQLRQPQDSSPERPAAPVATSVPSVQSGPRVVGAPGSEQSLRRTLELAQRAADLAVAEAREQGAAIVAAAEAEATAVVDTAEMQARTLTEEAQRDMQVEVTRLEAARDQLRSELEVLARVVDQERDRGRAWLAEVAAVLDRPVVSEPPVSIDPTTGAPPPEGSIEGSIETEGVPPLPPTT